MSQKRDLDWSDDERSTTHASKRPVIVGTKRSSPLFTGIGSVMMRDIARLGRPPTTCAYSEPHFVDYDFEPRPHPVTREYDETATLATQSPEKTCETNRVSNEDLFIMPKAVSHAYT
jgi:hypothetical protein